MKKAGSWNCLARPVPLQKASRDAARGRCSCCYSPDTRPSPGAADTSKAHRSYLLGRRHGPSVVAAEVGLQVQQVRVADRGVVIQDQPQRQFLRELVIQLSPIQVVVENAPARRKRRSCPTGARSQAVVNLHPEGIGVKEIRAVKIPK